MDFDDGGDLGGRRVAGDGREPGCRRRFQHRYHIDAAAAVVVVEAAAVEAMEGGFHGGRELRKLKLAHRTILRVLLQRGGFEA